MEKRTELPRLRPTRVVLLVAALALPVVSPAARGEVLSKHRDNRSYLGFRGEARILVGSGEHYGAVLNPDFDQRKVLDTLAADGLDFTRLFVRTYYEKRGDFGFGREHAGSRPGAVRSCRGRRAGRRARRSGGNKFDLARWSDAYFERLRGFVSEARNQAAACLRHRMLAARPTTNRGGPSP
jgi:hypothetical protein